MLLKIIKFLLYNSANNWKIFFLMPIVSFLDLVALYLFTMVITSGVSNQIIVYSVLSFFIVNLLVQIFSIGFFARYSYSIVRYKFSHLFKLLASQIPTRRKPDDYLQNFFSVEYFRVCERILLPFVVIVSKGLTAVIIFVFIFIQNPSIIILFGCAIFVLYLIIFTYIRPQIDRSNISISNAIDDINKSIHLLNAYKFESQIYNITRNLFASYSSAQKVYVFNSATVQKWSSIPRPIIEFLVFVGIVLALTGEQEWELEQLLAIGMGCLKIITSVQTIYYALTTIRGNISALEKYETLLVECTSLQEQEQEHCTLPKLNFNDLDSIIIQTRLKKENLHQSKSTVNLDLDLLIKKGQKCAIVGPSGAGKTTFLLALLGLNDELNVEFTLNGKKASASIDISKKLFGFVPQYPVVFEGTLRDNLNYYSGNSDLRLKNIIKEINLREANGELFSLEKHLGFKGNNISGGQAQRICLARALLNRRPILLLDEVTSGLDRSNTQRIISLIKNDPNQTVLWVTHDTNVIEKMQRIVKIGS
jgi:ABC-type transport system involved in cytochrome bd biosynthesis fused ATPase/permease subunit